jgi:hypothetical protein
MTGRWWAGLALVAMLAIGVAWWLHRGLDGIVQRAIGHYGSQMTGSRVAVDAVELRTVDGRGVIRGLVVGNPAGFRAPHAIKVSVIDVSLDARTIADPVVVIRRIVIESPDVIYEKGESQTNFEAIQQHIAQALGTSANRSDSGTGTSSGSRRLIVQELVIRNARAQATAAGLAGQSISTTLPDITLRDIGREQGGVTPAQLGQIVTKALTQRLVASLGFERAFKSLGGRVKGLLGH